MKILDFFLFLWVIFALLDPDPDPANQINADPCGSGYGSETLPEEAGNELAGPDAGLQHLRAVVLGVVPPRLGSTLLRRVLAL